MFASFLLGSAVAYNLIMAIYRLHFHKLSRFPGPRFAAATGFYEIYFSIWGAGEFEYKINEMHRKYGPVVRINPDEVHVQEPFGIAGDVDDWTRTKDTQEVEVGFDFYRSVNTHIFQIKIPAIAAIRSSLQVKVRQVLNALPEKHQVHSLVSSRVETETVHTHTRFAK
ncbi:hypothetical protein N7535_007769 [Penicillium sp. DV-2018c]|nr:hypothetical protein N7535_007769 [Penicillium sp. DV-2018c]